MSAQSMTDEFLAEPTADKQLQHYKLQNARLLEQQVALQQKVALQASSPPVTSEGGNVVIEFDASPDPRVPYPIAHGLVMLRRSLLTFKTKTKLLLL